MLNRLDGVAGAALGDLLHKAAEIGESARAATPIEGAERPDAPTLLAFLEHYYRHVDPEDLLGRGPADILGAALSHRALAAHRPQGRAAVRVFTPTVDEHGWSCGHTVVEIITDDMPFLVDSTQAELSRAGLAIHLVVHPQMPVRRDVAGAIELLHLGDEARPGEEVTLESWMHVEVDRVDDPDELDRVAAGLHRVLRDVREAVEDWPRMRAVAEHIAAELAEAPPAGLPGAQVEEARELLSWLAEDHFTFLGYREYRLDEVDGEEVLRVVPGTGLGILRADRELSTSFAALPAQVRARAREKALLILTKANSRSTVHRPAYLDYVGVKTFDAAGEVVGERRFLGLFTAAAYTESVGRIPVIRRKVAEVIERSGFAATSHSGKDLTEILETYPRDELFQITVDDLLPIAMAVLHLQERRQLRLFLRRDDYGRFVSCLVYLPRDRYTTAMRELMMAILQETFGGSSVDYTARVTESVLARLHFVVRVPAGARLPEVDPAEVEARLAEATRSWADDFADALRAGLGEHDAARALHRYADAFPEAYKEDFPARTAVADLAHLEALEQVEAPDALAMSLYEPFGAAPGQRRLKLYRREAVSLSRVLPVLAHMGVEVVDERPYVITGADGTTWWIYDFGLRYVVSAVAPSGSVKDRFQAAVEAVWQGRVEDDGLNALVLASGLTARQVALLRAYVRYLRQAGTPFSKDYIETCLRANAAVAGLLVALFEARFDPAYDELADTDATLTAQIRQALDAVESLDQDRILRSLLTLMLATVRTNYFQTDPDGAPKPYLSFKLDPQAIPELPKPRPSHEIWVYSPRVEGVHLRFGAVARGGVRWSDRREDFRTEILGLVKAQTVKNAVIVPTGAKGGFVGKALPDPTVDRDAWLAEGIACYRTLIAGMLDITDNLVTVEGKTTVAPPPQVRRHDDDDPYLVVAADKGTAKFSDIANAVAADYGYWLGDAFASGGSAGYDHKAMGITARGAWESVKRHFRELGVDTQAQDFTAVGIGDMSGDVFGNGMLRSPHLRLVAAFDHRHVFLDPNPDAAASFAERRRLFELPRSSWADYDVTKISQGGGVFSRSAKSVPISPEVREALGLDAGVSELRPAELVRAVLTAPVDLVWNGGIGTYVKASTESHAQVGDKSNDAVRVDGAMLRARVVGEGGNLGMTQLGRIEYAQAGGRVNTDAIDNSAGVDTSDHEVNIKIMLGRIVAAGDLTLKVRNELLASMTEDVVALVLRDNYEQNVLLGNARRQSAAMLSVHARFIRDLERRGELDRALEFLPTDAEIRRRTGAGVGLTSPEFAVLVAYSKLSLKSALLTTSLPDQPWFTRALSGYFPAPLVQRYGEVLAEHPLHREIVTTAVVNDMVNRGGITFVFRAQEEVGASPAEITCAYTVARQVFGLEQFWSDVAALDTVVPTDAQTTLYLEARRLLDRATRWLLQSRHGIIDIAAEVDRFGPGLATLLPLVPELLRGHEAEQMRRRAAELAQTGIPEPIAVHTAALLYGFPLLDVVEIATRTERPVEDVARLYFTLSDTFDVDQMLSRITALPREDRWQALARSSLRYDLYAALATLTTQVLASTPASDSPEARAQAWATDNAAALARGRATLGEIIAGDSADLATLSVALRAFRTMLHAG